MQKVISKSEVVSRSCDALGCDKSVQWDNMVELTNEKVEELNSFYTVVREIYDWNTGHFGPMYAHACCLEHVPVAALKIAVTPVIESKVNLADLQVSRDN